MVDHLKTQAAPNFRNGNTLLPLTISFGGQGVDVPRELAARWGYAYQFPMYGSSSRESTSYWAPPNDQGNTSLFLSDIRAQPGKFKIAAGNGSLYNLFNNHDGAIGWLPRLGAGTWLRDAGGRTFIDNGRPVVSPLASDADLYKAGEFIGNTLAALEEYTGQRVDLYLNEGEHGLWFPGDKDYALHFGRDPAVMAAFNQFKANSPSLDWPDFISFHRARQERQFKLGLFKTLKKAPVYSVYQESFGGERGRWAGWSWWMFKHEYFYQDGKPLVSDHASPEMYYELHNYGWTGVHTQQGLPYDAITVALREVGGSLSLGQKFFYPWVSMGWEGSGNSISEDDRFLGAMKVWYTAGALGAVAGYFNYQEPLFTQLRLNQVVGAAAPTFVRQLRLQSHAHGLFTHLERYLREGDLLPGPNKHPYQSFSPETPAMEFPIEGQTITLPGGTAYKPTARMLVRKIRNQDDWLVTVWANTGEDRNISVSFDPRVGPLPLRARKAGSVYRVTLPGGKPRVELMDTDAMDPTRYLFP